MVKRIGFIVGSLRQGSFTRQVAEQFAPKLGDAEVHWIDIGDLPLYNQDLDVGGEEPETWTSFRAAISGMDGIVFFTPEYNRSVPGVLKNAIDVGSRPQNAWAKKPAAIISVSPGAIGAFGANHHLRQSLVFLDMPTLQQPEAYISRIHQLLDDGGKLVPETDQFLQLIADAYLDFLGKLVD